MIDAQAGRTGDAYGTRVAVRLTLLPVALGVAWLLYGLFRLGWAGWYGQDLRFYTAATARLLAGEGWFLTRQLAGPYLIQAGDVLYPPTTAWLFAPWLVLPTWAFIATPIVITGWAVVRLRPAPRVWPLMGLCAMWPETIVKVIAANPGLWVMSAVALGALVRWPAVFALLKPTLAPFALLGVRSRAWWVALGGVAVATVPVIESTLLYPRVLMDARGGGVFYSLWDLPMVLLPTFAWLGRRR